MTARNVVAWVVCRMMILKPRYVCVYSRDAPAPPGLPAIAHSLCSPSRSLSWFMVCLQCCVRSATELKSVHIHNCTVHCGGVVSLNFIFTHPSGGKKQNKTKVRFHGSVVCCSISSTQIVYLPFRLRRGSQSVYFLFLRFVLLYLVSWTVSPVGDPAKAQHCRWPRPLCVAGDVLG